MSVATVVDDPYIDARVAAHSLQSAVSRLNVDLSIATLGVGFHRQVRTNYVPVDLLEIRKLIDAIEASFAAGQADAS